MEGKRLVLDYTRSWMLYFGFCTGSFLVFVFQLNFMAGMANEGLPGWLFWIGFGLYMLATAGMTYKLIIFAQRVKVRYSHARVAHDHASPLL